MMARREIRIKYGDQRKGDEFVRWADPLGNDREAYVLREIPKLPSKPGSIGYAWVSGLDGKRLVVRGALSRSADWFLPTEEYGRQWVQDEDIRNFTPYIAVPESLGATRNDLYEVVVQMINRGGYHDEDEVNRIVDGLEESQFFIGREITVEEVKESVNRYADSVSRHNGFTWITDAGRRLIAEAVVEDLNNRKRN